MAEDNIASFDNLDRNESSFNARVKRHDFCWQSGTDRLKGDFFYLPFRDGNLTKDEFLRFIIQEVIKYASPYSERETAHNESSASNQAPIIALKNKVRALFQNTNTASEFGELIMYIILRDFFDAPQIVSKMILKTSGNMPYHGSDGLHIKFDSNIMILYHGESKMYSGACPNAAIDNAIESSKEFLTNAKLKNNANAKDFEIDLINSHFSLPGCTEEQKKAILAYFNPMTEQYNDSKDVAVCLVGFDMDFYKNLPTTGNIDELFKNEYKQKIESATSHFAQKVKGDKLTSHNFHFLLLPFESITDFRTEFLRKLDEY